MIFNRHLELVGKHAPLSPSKYYWMADDEEGFFKRWVSSYMAQVGTILHDEARKRIEYGIKTKKSDKNNLIIALLEGGIPRGVVNDIDMDICLANFMNYTNDSIGFMMEPEVCLKYSEDCFGHADAVGYDENERILRINDMKTGSTPVHIEQLLGYAGLFCLEYKIDPRSLKGCELRIYQLGDIIFHTPGAEELNAIVQTIMRKDELIKLFKRGGV